jgi:hypothetical protein
LDRRSSESAAAGVVGHRYAPHVGPLSSERGRVIGLGGLFLLALVVGLELARPLRSASVAFDSQVAVVHFDRIVSGRPIEVFLSTTPKPLLTVIYGSLHALTGDWRPIAWAAILAFGLAIAGVGALVGRAAGPVAGAFSALAVLASPTLLFDVGFALATPWALLGWVAAGLALTAERPRYGLAGLALFLASLARLETLVLVGVALVVLIGSHVTRNAAPRRAWLVPLIGFAALLVMGAHDWLLSGDPLLWSKVAIRYTEETTLHVLSPGEVVAFLIGRYAVVGAVSLLAVIGVIRLFAARQFAIAFGLIGLGPGVAAFLVFLAMRGIFVSDRYAASIDIAVAAAAGVALGGISIDVLERIASTFPRLTGAGTTAGVVAAAVAAVLMTWPQGPFNDTLRSQVRTNLDAGADADRAASTIMAELATTTSRPSPLLYVPTSVQPRMAVDLGLSLTEVEGTDGLTIDLAEKTLQAGEVVVHDRRAERHPGALAALEVTGRTVIGGLTIEPLLADPRRGLWVLAVR